MADDKGKADPETAGGAPGASLVSPGGSRSARASTYQERVMADLMFVWERLGAGVLPRRVAVEIAQRSGHSRATSHRYVAAALRVLQGDQLAEPIESKRARIIAMAQEGVRAAMARERAYVVNVGRDEQVVERVPDPDTKGAAMHLAIIARIELGA